MKPKEKLQYLLDKLYYLNSYEKKKLAIIVFVNEVKEELSNFDTMHGCIERLCFWDEVKKELDKL